MASNPLGINYSAGGGSALYFEALPMHKNQLRGSRGFTDTGFNPLPVVNGWPTTDFRIQLCSFSTKLPAWANGTFKCGFIGSGSESIAGTGGTVANVVHGSGGAYTTFDFTVSTTGNIFLDVTGTTGGVTNFFAYIPGQYPGSPQIDDVTNTSSIITSTATHYSQFNHIRNMWLSNIVSFTQQATSTLRHTPSNFQCGSPTTNFGSIGQPKKVNLTVTPTTGATSATLASNWTGDSGLFALSFQDQSGSGDCRIVTLTNGATTCTWDASRALTQPWANSTGTVAYEGYPVEWLITLCNASGAAPWICLPMFEDGAEGSAGSWSTSVLNYVASNYTGTKPIIFELGNEDWNVSYQTFFMAQELYRLYGFSDVYNYYAYRHHQFATLARSVLPAGWFGTKVLLAHMSQFVVPGQQINVLSDYNTNYGPPKNDIGYMGAAIYCNPITTNTDTIAQIQSEFNTAALTVANVETNSAGGPGEQTAVIGLHYGIPAATYEGGPQWNASQYNGLTNLGAAIMDTGYTAPMQTHYNSIYNAGFVLATHFQGGVNSSTAGTAPVDELSNDYTLLPTCPALVGLQASLPPNNLTITRNDISTIGTVIDGRNYTDNTPSISSTFPTLGGNGSTNPSLAPYGAAGAGTCAYLLWSTVNRTVNLSVNFTNSGGTAGVTQLEWGSVLGGGFSVLGGGTPTQVSVPTGTNQVTVGTFPLSKGWNYVLLGKPGTTQASISINSLTAGGVVALSIGDHKAGTQGNPTPALTANTNPTIGDALCVFLTASTGGALTPVITDADGAYAAVGSPFSDATNTAWGQWFWRTATTTTIPTISVSGVAKSSALSYVRATGFAGTATLDTASTAQGNFSGTATTSYAVSPLQTNFNNEVALIGNTAGTSVSAVSGTWTIQTASHLFTNIVATAGTNISMAGTLTTSSWYDSAVMSVYDASSGPIIPNAPSNRSRRFFIGLR